MTDSATCLVMLRHRPGISVRSKIADSVEEVFSRVTEPRLVQMHEAFSTSYANFSEQLLALRQNGAALESMAKKSYILAVKVVKDVEEGGSVGTGSGSYLAKFESSSWPCARA